MNDLIDRKVLRNQMYHEAFETDTPMQRWDGGCWIRYKLFENTIEAQPVVDAVPVVRCKDCKYMGEVSLTHNGDYIVNSCGYHNSFVNKNDYCSRAERKNDATLS